MPPFFAIILEARKFNYKKVIRFIHKDYQHGGWQSLKQLNFWTSLRYRSAMPRIVMLEHNTSMIRQLWSFSFNSALKIAIWEQFFLNLLSNLANWFDCHFGRCWIKTRSIPSYWKKLIDPHSKISNW